VGVVQNVDLPGSGPRIAQTQLYFALPGAPQRVSLIVGSRLPVHDVRTLVRDAVKRVGAGIRIGGYTTPAMEVAHGQAMIRFTLTLLGIFAALALVMAALGLHAVIAYSVSQRTRELGIRMALGAEARGVARLVIGQGVVLGVLGTLAGCAIALVATRLLRTLLWGVEPRDPWTLAAVSAGLLIVSIVASASPAWRATKISPVETMRAE
jgi:putative ABC transport system permease protein